MFPFCLPIRVYYEDTDHGGVVYYANYLKFMERARTEYLRDCGLELDQLASGHNLLFVVREANIRYHRPARFNDLLQVRSALGEMRGARLCFCQDIYRGETLLVQGQIHLACTRSSGTARRIPPQIQQVLKEREVTRHGE